MEQNLGDEGRLIPACAGETGTTGRGETARPVDPRVRWGDSIQSPTQTERSG